MRNYGLDEAQAGIKIVGRNINISDMQILLLSRFSRVRFLGTPQTAAYQAPPSMGFFRQEYWNGLPFPFPGDLPDPGIEPGSPTLQADVFTI